MKKLCIVILIILLLTGCDTVDNKSYTFNQITYQVPTEWDVRNNDDIVYYYPKTGFLMLQKSNIRDSSNMTTDEKETLLDSFEAGVSDSTDSYEKIDSKQVFVDTDILAREISFYTVLNDERYESKTIIFPYKDCVYSLCFANPKEIVKNDLDIFNNIINSVVGIK